MKFIVFEGLDGAGKSSLIEAVAQKLSSKSQGFVKTREPGGTALAENIRGLLLSVEGDTPVPRAELLLYEAGRAQHVDKIIRPTLKSGRWVLCDRFTASSVAFQSGGRALKREHIDWLNDFATESLKPDLTILLDLTVQESRKRLSQRHKSQNTQDDRFEKEEEAFHNRVRESYLQQAKENSGSWIVLDSSKPKETLQKELLEILEQRGWL